MKKRTISAVIAALIFVPLYIIGGLAFNIAIYIVALLGLREFIKAKNVKKETPLFIEFISYVMLSLLVFSTLTSNTVILNFDLRILAGCMLVFSIPALFYQDKKIYTISDAFYFIGGIIFLGISFSLIILIRNIDINLLTYLLIITIITDTYAYITGSLIGKHKLLEEVSPKKTWEGTIGGSVFGTILAVMFYITVIDSTLPLIAVIVMTLFLSIIGQFGDLVFSSIKRYYKIKDFSSIMPGHGGILDRLDSIIFVVLAFTFFMTII